MDPNGSPDRQAIEFEPESVLEDFARLITHELMTPLTVIGSAADMAAEMGPSEDPGRLRELLQIVQRNTSLTVSMLRRLSTARDVEADDVSLRPESVDLRRLVNESVDDLWPVVLCDHRVDLRAPVSVTLDADPVALREIVFNLLSNAAKYSAAGAQIVVAVDQVRNVARLVVRNHGSGVTPGDTETIFHKFFQSDLHAPGSGLGLYIARGLARAHGGDLQVQAAEDEGSEFRLTLPMPA